MKDHTDILNDYETSLERQLVILLHKEENINASIQDLNEQLNAKHRSLETNEKQQIAVKEKLAAVKHLKAEFHFNKSLIKDHPTTRLDFNSSKENVKPLADFQIKTLTTKDLIAMSSDSFKSLKSFGYSNPWSPDMSEPYSALSDMLYKH